MSGELHPYPAHEYKAVKPETLPPIPLHDLLAFCVRHPTLLKLFTVTFAWNEESIFEHQFDSKTRYRILCVVTAYLVSNPDSHSFRISGPGGERTAEQPDLTNENS